MASYLLRNSPVPTSEKKFTFSTWLKMSDASTSADNGIVEWYKSSSERYQILIDSATRQLRLYAVESGAVKATIYSNMVFRDTNAWYHIVIHSDTTQSSSSNAFKLWVNGVAQTFASYTWSYSQNANVNVFDGSSTRLNLGTRGEAYATWLNGYLADTYYIDGSLIANTEFGATDSTSGIWKPNTQPTISSFGNAGFHLKYENSSNIGLDSSGNTNNFSTSGTITQAEDNPSNVFATLNAINNYYPEATFSNGNLKITTKESAPVMSTLGVSSGKWYWEVKVNALASTYGNIGIVARQATAGTQHIAGIADCYGYYSDGSIKDSSGSTSSGYDTYTANDIIGIAMDLDNNRLFVSKNGTWQNSADPTSSTGAYTITAPASTSLGAYFPAISYWDDNDAANGTYEANFGNGRFGTTALASSNSDSAGLGLFEYSVPSGFYSLCTKNIKNYG